MINGMILILVLLISPFLDGDVPQRPSYGVYIFQLIRFARASSHVTDFNNRNKFLTAKLLKQGYRYHKLCKAFSKFFRRHFELIEKYHVSHKKLMQQGICYPELYGDLVYKFKKIIGNLLSFTCNYVVFVWRGFLFLWVLGMGFVILLWHSLSLPYNYSLIF